MIIIPDGPLLGLSFAELVAPSGRYLVEDYTLQYAPSMALLKRTSAPNPVNAGNLAVLLVSLSTGYPKSLGETLAPLPGARREVDALAALFPARTTMRVNDNEATEQRVREAMAQGGTVPAVLSAANEVAVEAFVEGRIAFGDIARIIEASMAQVARGESTLAGVRAADREARITAAQLVKEKVTSSC